MLIYYRFIFWVFQQAKFLSLLCHCLVMDEGRRETAEIRLKGKRLHTEYLFPKNLQARRSYC